MHDAASFYQRPNLKNLSRVSNLRRGSNTYGWFRLKLYSVFRDLSRRSIETDLWWFSDMRFKFVKFGLRILSFISSLRSLRKSVV